MCGLIKLKLSQVGWLHLDSEKVRFEAVLPTYVTLHVALK